MTLSRPDHSANDYDHLPRLLLPIVVFFGLAIRLPGLGYSFYGDEIFSVLRDSSQLVTTSEDRFRPVFFTLLYLWRQLGFSGEVGLRLLPLLFGVTQIPVAYLVGKKLVGQKLGITFAVLIAASPILIEFSQELRMYSLVSLIALTQVYVLLLLQEKSIEPLNSSHKVYSPNVLWIMFGLLGLLGVYTHLHYWFFIAGLALTCLRLRKVLPLWKTVVAFALMVCLYLPNIPNVIKFQEIRGGDYFVDTVSALPKLLAGFTVGFNYFKIHDQGIGRPVDATDLHTNIALLVLVLIPIAIILWRIMGMHRESRNLKTIWLCHELFTAPALFALVATFILHKYFVHPKYLIFSAPFFLLIIASAYVTLNFAALRRLITLFGIAVTAVAFIHFNDSQEYGRRENWKGVTEYLKYEVNSESPLLLLAGYSGMLNYYDPGNKSKWKSVDIPATYPSISLWEDKLRTILAQSSYVYYLRLDVRQMHDDPSDLVLTTLDRLGVRLGIIQFNPRLRLYHWKINIKDQSPNMLNENNRSE